MNLSDEPANLSPQQAAPMWPQYRAISAQTGVKIVGPAITWAPFRATRILYSGSMLLLYSAYRAANSNHDPQIDYLAFHWYDYGLDDQLDRLAVQKSFWVTGIRELHSQNDGAQITTPRRAREANDENGGNTANPAWTFFATPGSLDAGALILTTTSLLGAPGELTPLGTTYLSLPKN